MMVQAQASQVEVKPFISEPFPFPHSDISHSASAVRVALVELTSTAKQIRSDPKIFLGCIPQSPGDFHRAGRPDIHARMIRQQRSPDTGPDECSRFKIAKLEYISNFSGGLLLL
ncbi:hypothetical protein HZ326_24925 [Fusarium oxysporum f. sp. albedinis]|nr:hypothetical protein HZ326_24925 [Fusarium oxysporum f. sp. albedinis]